MNYDPDKAYRDRISFKWNGKVEIAFKMLETETKQVWMWRDRVIFKPKSWQPPQWSIDLKDNT